MSNYKLMTGPETVARRHVVDVAEAVLNGDLPLLEGAVQLAALKWEIGGIAPDDSDFNVFVGIASETEPLPLQAQRTFWDSEALARLEPEFTRAEEWVSAFALPACRNLLARFGTKSDLSAHP